jgi:peroxiredoxin
MDPKTEMTSQKLQPGFKMPVVMLPVAGGGETVLGRGTGWQIIVVYRGKHCPICRTYLEGLNGLLDACSNIGAEVIAVSADTKEKAETESKDEDWKFKVGYDLSPDQMRKLGLYISTPRSPEETDRPFSEPGVFVVNPDGNIQVIDISNAPYARPDLDGLLKGLKFVQEKHYPVRGTMQ